MRLPVYPISPNAQVSHLPTLETGPQSIAAVQVLRISVTDRCNFRCVYCMPEEGVRWLPKDDILSFEEIVDIVRAARDTHGIRRFKLTGGEPTVRHGLVDLVGMLHQIGGIDDLSLTTNGFCLEELAGPLRHAGLGRVTVSLDSLNPEKFRRITRTGNLEKVLRGIRRAIEVGFESIKINCVAMAGTNDDEFADFARLAIDLPVSVRFIEYMPLGDAALMHVGPSNRVAAEEIGPAGGCGAQQRGTTAFVAETEIRSAIEAAHGPLRPIDRSTEAGVGPAVPYRLASPTAQGKIGFISAMSAPFCSTCNRLRLTANGILRSCLFEGGEVDFKPILRHGDGASRAARIASAMVDCVRLKPQVHSHHGNEQMSRIGG